MHLDFVSTCDGDFRRGSDIRVKRLHMRKPAVDTLRSGLAPADSLGHCVEHGEVSRMLAHQLAPELKLVLADGLCQLVHKTLQEDGILVDVHATPKARLDMRIAHGMVDHEVRDRI